MAQILNSRDRKNARKLAEAQERIAKRAGLTLITPTTSIIPPFDRQNPILELISALVFWPIFGVLWVIVNAVKLFHRIFSRIPDRQVNFVINPLGAFRLFFWVWLCTSIGTYSFQLESGVFPWIALGEFGDLAMKFIDNYTFGLGSILLGLYLVWAVIAGSVMVLFNAADNNVPNGNRKSGQYNSKFDAINETLRFRDAHMDQQTNQEKMETFAQTGFLTNQSFNNSQMTDNELEAANFLNAELAQRSSGGKLERLTELFTGKK